MQPSGGERLRDRNALCGEFVGGADHRSPVTLVNAEIAAGTGHHVARVAGLVAVDHRDRREIAVYVPQCAVPRHNGPGDDEVDACGRNGVGGAGQARLDDRWRGEIGYVQDCAGPVVLRHGRSKDAVGEPGHHAHGRIGLPGQQRYLEVQVVVIVGADHRLRVGHTGGGQVVRRLHGGDARSGIGQLVDDPDPQRVVAADDEVAGHASTLLKKTSPRRVKMGHGR